MPQQDSVDQFYHNSLGILTGITIKNILSMPFGRLIQNIRTWQSIEWWCVAMSCDQVNCGAFIMLYPFEVDG